MCKFSSKSGGVPFQPLGDLTWNDPATSVNGESQYRTNSKTTMPIIFSANNSFTSCCGL